MKQKEESFEIDLVPLPIRIVQENIKVWKEQVTENAKNVEVFLLDVKKQKQITHSNTEDFVIESVHVILGADGLVEIQQKNIYLIMVKTGKVQDHL